MSSRRTTLISVLVVVVVVTVGLVIASSRHTPELPPVKLADGTTVRVVAFGVGRQHFTPYVSPAERLAAFIPSKLQRWFPVKPAMPANFGGTPSLAVWLEWDRTPSAAITNTSPSSASFLLFLHDGRSFLISSLAQTTGKLPDGRYYEWHFFPVPPPSIPQVTASLYPKPQWGGEEPDTGLPLAEWTLNRAVRTAARTNLTAEPLPQTRQLDDLEVTLKSLVIDADGSAPVTRVMPASHPTEARSDARFALRLADGPATDWQVERIISLTDAFGNQSPVFGWNHGHDYIRWRWPLWPNQPWKLVVEFTRTNGFTSDEVWTVAGLLPRQTLSNLVTLATGTIQSVELMPSNWGPRYWQIEARFTPVKAPGRLTLISAKTADGLSLKTSPHSSGDNISAFRLDGYSTNRGPLDVTLALQLGRIAEFIVEPALLNTNTTPQAGR